MDCFSFLPIEILEIFLSYLDNRQLEPFIDFYMVHATQNINWNTVYFYRFQEKSGKKLIQEEYIKILIFEKLKRELDLNMTMEKLERLKNLSISQMNIFTIPNEIGTLKNLRELYLENNSLFMLPGEIGEILGLQRLHLRNNNLSLIPIEISKLKNIKHIDLGKNYLTSLPKEIGKLAGT